MKDIRSSFTRSGTLAGLLCASALALWTGCGQPVDGAGVDNGDDLRPSSTPVLPDGPGTRIGGAHVMRVHNGVVNTANQNVELFYFGGHVLSNVKVYAVFWTSAVRAATQSGIGGFFTAVTANPYIDWLSEYNTTVTPDIGGTGTNQTIGRGSYAGSVTLSPHNTSRSLSNEDIIAELNAQLDGGALAAPDANTIYMLYFPAGYSISLGTAKSCTYFCAYHNTFVRNGQSVYYGVMPDVGADGCQLGCGTDPSVFNNLTVTSSHELVEAITDAEVGLALDAAPPLAWYNQAKGEIGDICAPSEDTLPGTTYKVQKEWSNRCNACITMPDASCGGDYGPITDLIAPGAGDTITGTVKVQAGVRDNGAAITQVKFYVDLFALIGTATAAPWSINYNTANLKAGNHYLSAVATDAKGRKANSHWLTVTK